ncbi:MurR/RpiR family transcriptional regulator [Enterococcus faecium]|uniref:MurR/RpiR family transcriptional regulator n=1 Tax=Enterococcus faecium TaxID=1352 RepID=UPI00295E525D|nr:MurR/RpiR family transcriptional regulator [Enterococcus faecium]WOV56325.1 MurR/RpiR family transcriptional regulator [Enterococcus faecium]
MELFEKLKRLNDVTSSEEIIMDYIFSNSGSVIDMTIYDLAKVTNTSASSIIRLCKKCGYSGFRSLKINLTESIYKNLNSVQQVDVNVPFKDSDTDIMVAKQIAQLSMETINATFNLLSTKQLNNAIKKITTSKEVYAVGSGDNYLRLCDFQVKLLLINFYVKMSGMEAEQPRLARFSEPDDAAIVVSYSGETPEIIKIAQQFHQNQTPIIAITSDENSQLAKLADEVLLIPNKENSALCISNFSSRIATEYLLNALYSCIYKCNYKQNCQITMNNFVY